MAGVHVPDALWKLIEPLLSIPSPKPQGGRPRLTDRGCLAGRGSRIHVIDLRVDSRVYFRYASCSIAPVGRCCSILLWHLLLSLAGSRLDTLRDALSLAGHLDAGLPGKPETGVTPLQPRAHRGSTGGSRRIVICAAPNIPARLRAHLVVPYRL